MLSGNIEPLNINGDINTNIGLSGDIDNNIDLDTSIIENNSLSGDVSTSVGLNGDLDNAIQLDAIINPITMGTEDYNRLINKPKVNYVELVDNKTLDDLNIQVKGDYPDEALTNAEIEALIDSFV
jgi:hypothetical protein